MLGQGMRLSMAPMHIPQHLHISYWLSIRTHVGSIYILRHPAAQHQDEGNWWKGRKHGVVVLIPDDVFYSSSAAGAPGRCSADA